MKLFTALLLTLGMFAGLNVKADERNPAGWSCSLQFEAKGHGLQIFVGKFALKGPGVLSCENEAGDMKQIPMNVTMGGKLFQPQIAAGWMTVKGLIKAFGINGSPEALAGKYYVANAQLAVLGGVGATVGFDVKNDDNLTLGMSLQVTKGFGIAVGVERLTLEVAQ